MESEDYRVVLGVRVPDPNLEGATFSVLRLDGPFSLLQPVTPTLNFYFVRRGKVMFECKGNLARRVVLTPSTCLGLSARITHSFKCAEPESTSVKPVIRNETTGTPDQGESVEIFCAVIPEECMLYVRAFREITIIFPDAAPRIVDSIRAAVEWIERESRQGQNDLSSPYIIRRMIEIIQMEFGRFVSLQQPGLMLSMHAANADKRILRAMTAMYREPRRQWTLQSLAEEAGMSRTGFAARYRELTGITPMNGLQRLRLKRAAEELMNKPALPIEVVAENWGYQSAAVFVRAFTREFGMAPGRWRHSAQHK